MGEGLGRVSALRPVLLSAPYGPAEGNLEVALHLPSGLRTTGLVEVMTDGGLVGLGEGYLAVFAPRVFVAIAELLAPLVVGRDLADLPAIVRDLEMASGYWSAEGAARHVLSAIEIGLQDARAQALGLPLWRALGGTEARALPVYASGGDARDPAHMAEEIAAVAAVGARLFKIRARPGQAAKAIWCARAAAAEGIAIAVDMTQNLASPSVMPSAVAAFLDAHRDAGVAPPAFLEEIQGPEDIDRLPALRRSLGVPVAGGEIVTTPAELARRIAAGLLRHRPAGRDGDRRRRAGDGGLRGRPERRRRRLCPLLGRGRRHARELPRRACRRRRARRVADAGLPAAHALCSAISCSRTARYGSPKRRASALG